MRPSVTVLAGAAVALVFASALAVGLVPVAAHGVNHLSADPQVSADGVVVLAAAFATEDGFLVLYRGWDGTTGEVAGVRSFSASTADVTEVRVRIDRGWPAEGPVRLTAVSYADSDGDGRFGPDDDPLASFGGVTQTSFAVRAGSAPAYVSAAGLGPQRTTGPVTVRVAALPADGHLVLRRSEGGEPGTVLGSTPLSGGVHRNVTVPLADPPNGTEAVFAVAYGDDGDGRFGDGDRPVRVDGEPVATRVSVAPPTTDGVVTATPDPGEMEGGDRETGRAVGAGLGLAGTVAATVWLVWLLGRR
jgi:hypothetical protein